MATHIISTGLDVPRSNPVQLISLVPFHIWGAVGVALFFVISGFVIPFTLQSRGSGAFLLARVLRIWPTLVVSLLIATVAVACGSWIESRPLPWNVLDLLANVSLLGSYLAISRIDGVVWTLEIEIKFYVLIALFAGVVRRGQFAHVSWRAGSSVSRVCGPASAISAIRFISGMRRSVTRR